ncbi:MAG: hypothetical protein ACTSV2_10245 [Candidatus Thorarchaeota archaeon]
MIVIEGNEKIHKTIDKELKRTWKKLSLKYRKVKGKILFAHLFTINHRYTPTNENDYPTEDANLFRSMLRTLDMLLERGWSLVDTHMPEEELNRFSRIVLREFTVLGKLRQLQLECNAFSVKRIEYSEEQGLSDATAKLIPAFHEWLQTPRLDKDWIDFTDESRNRAPQLLKAINQELQHRYNITLEVLDKFGRDISTEIKLRLEPVETKMASLILFRKQDLIQRLSALDNNIEVGTLIGELEYKSQNNWMRTPFVKLKDNSTQRMLYFPFTFAFYPTHVFAASWIYFISKTVRKTSAMGIMSEDWGRRFERYVREKLASHHPTLKVHPGTTKISRADSPDILDCIGKPNVEIDVIAQSDSKVYLISCKAQDQFYGSTMMERLLGNTADEFENKLKEDIENAGEIENYANCIQQSKEYLESEGFDNKVIIPILMTSDVRPLSLKSVREWSLDVRISKSLPNVQIIHSKEISERVLD